MSWQTPRERDFSLAGPFLAKRDGNAGDLELQFGKVYTADELHAASNTDRHIQRMYAAHWLDMAPPVEAESTEPAAPSGGEGSDQGQGDGAASAGADEGAGGGEQSSPDATEEGGAAEGDAATPPADTGEPPVSDAAIAAHKLMAPPEDVKLAAYKNMGFGKFFAVNAAGEKLDPSAKEVNKATAAGFAARDAVPLLGQNGEPITQE